MDIEIIRKDFHKLIEEVQNPDDLEIFYNALKLHSSQAKEELWDSLPKSEKDEILLADKESETQENLIDIQDAKKEFKRWLSE